jgi:hypothetical protein
VPQLEGVAEQLASEQRNCRIAQTAVNMAW